MTTVAPKFRWYRLTRDLCVFSLLVMVVAVALPFSWLAAEMKKAKEQSSAVERITELGAYVQYDWEVIDITGGVGPGLHCVL